MAATKSPSVAPARVVPASAGGVLSVAWPHPRLTARGALAVLALVTTVTMVLRRQKT